MVKAGVIGTFSLKDSTGTDISPKSNKAACILVYLLLSKGHSARRSLLTSLLWSESNDTRGRASLRQAIKELRLISSNQSKPFLDIDKSTVSLVRDQITSDVDLVTEALGSKNIKILEALFGNGEIDLLTDLQTIDPLFDSWLRVENENFQSKTVETATSILSDEDLNPTEKKALSQVILSIDPFAETALKVQLETMSQSGDIRLALHTFATYERRLKQEYELEPSEPLYRYIEKLKSPANSGALNTIPGLNGKRTGLTNGIEHGLSQKHNSRPVIGVSMRRPTGDAEEDRFISEAFRNDLFSTISRFNEWMAINLDPELAAETIGEARDLRDQEVDWGIDYLVECRVRQSADRKYEVDVTFRDFKCQLVEFSHNYTIKSHERLALLNDITCKIASCLQRFVLTSRLHKARMKSTSQRAAYDYWLEGQHLLTEWDPRREHEKIALFEQAISLDPGFAMAYSSIAATLNSRWFVLPGRERDDAELVYALDLASKALELDPLDSRNHVNVAWSHLLAGRYECAELHFANALRLNPVNPNVLIAAALAQSFSGNHPESQRLCTRAFELNPAPPIWYFGYKATIAFLNGQFDDCVDAVHSSKRVFPDILGWAAAANYRSGNLAEAKRDLRDFYDELALVWAGSNFPSKQNMRDWFCETFPIRHMQQREMLRSSISAVALLEQPSHEEA